MRHWIFHPLVFYPLAALVVVGVILGSLKPQAWPREAAAHAGRLENGILVLDGAAFDAPAGSPDQHMTVVRDFWGAAEALRIAVLPGQPEPSPAETGVRVLLTPEAAATIADKPVLLEVWYRPVPVNMASGLAVSLQGAGPADWVSQSISPVSGTVRFDLPASFAVNAIGLRAISAEQDQAYGLEIARIRVLPGTLERANN